MKHTVLVFLTWLLVKPMAFAQLTPVQSLNLEPQEIEVPEKFSSAFTADRSVNLPPGYKARIFYAGGLGKPRFLSFDHKRVLHVADMSNGKVYAMPDKNQDGVADTLLVAADGFSGNHDVKFYNRFMYVTEENKVWKLADEDSNGVYESRSVLIDNIAQGAPTGGHRTRSIAIDPLNGNIYLSIGSACNACREQQRAIIEQYNPDGTNKRTFASGTRNAVGLTFHPTTNRLWANNNGSDNLGNSIPPEWIDMVREDGFYGYPIAYGNKTWVDFDAAPDYQALLPITSQDSQKVNRMIAPAALIEAHSAPMGITFLNSSFGTSMQHGMITALRGSWNAPGDHRGYKLIYVDFTDAQDTTANFVADFCTGFITDTVARTYWARPVGIAITDNGEVFMSSDETNKFIIHIYYDKPVGMHEINDGEALAVYPNPAKNKVCITLKSAGMPMVKLYDIHGKEMTIDVQRSQQEIAFSTAHLKPGVYQCVVNTNGKQVSRKLIIE